MVGNSNQDGEDRAPLTLNNFEGAAEDQIPPAKFLDDGRDAGSVCLPSSPRL